MSAAPVISVRDAFCVLEAGDRAVAALRGIDLTVASGERVLVHGPNGSGKTTLLRVLIGEQRLDAGDAVVAGWNVGRGDRSGLARWRTAHVGWVDQHAGRTLRPEFGVLDNVALQQRLGGVGRRAARTAAREALDLVGVGALAERSIDTLSGGEAQRVAVAAALVHRPQVIFADEPAGQLDADGAVQVHEALAAAASGVGAALLVVSHDDRAAAIADRVLRIRDGRVSETWRPDAPDDELLVVDDRGWVRLPVAARRVAGLGAAIRVRAQDGRAVLVPGTPPDGVRAPAGDGDMPAPIAAGSVTAGSVTAGSVTAGSVTAGSGEGAAAARAGVVSCTAVVRRFADRMVVDGVTLTCSPGEVLVVHGRSGSGKSTLLRILTGLDDPDEGTVQLLGDDLPAADRAGRARRRRSGVGMVQQEIHLDETATLRENLDLARAVRGMPADQGGDLALLDELGLGDLADRQARRCSGGERQRAALARAVVGSPALVVLDEPTSQLDETSAVRVVQFVARLADRGAAVVIASHDPLVLAAATRLLALGSGAPARAQP